MNKRTIKQIVIALIFLLILSGIGFLIYYSNKPAPTCDDGIKNQDEIEIDCGGLCPSCELAHIKDIEILWVKVIANKDNFYDLAAKIRNPNQNYGSGNMAYKFELYDSQNNLIVNYSGSTYILPNQTKFLLKTRAESSSLVKKIKISFSDIEWDKPEDYQPPQLVVQQKEYRLLSGEDTGYSQLRAVLANKTSYDFDKIDIDILLFDSSQRLIAINTNEIATMLSGQERDFFSTWFNPINGEVSFIEIEAETNIFNEDNYLSGSRESEKFQEY